MIFPCLNFLLAAINALVFLSSVLKRRDKWKFRKSLHDLTCPSSENRFLDLAPCSDHAHHHRLCQSYIYYLSYLILSIGYRSNIHHQIKHIFSISDVRHSSSVCDNLGRIPLFLFVSYCGIII
jgi:hypothetical protein